MRILVLGGYGLIGSHVVRRLIDAGYDVAGLGRGTARAERREPSVIWIAADLGALTSAAAWAPVLARSRPVAIVNCAGALQDGARDDVSRVQSDAMRALYEAAAAAGVTRVIQISAPRADPKRDTAFMRSKGEADAALSASALDWVILRPGLVLSPEAYGGSALLRALAAVPLVQPVAFADCLVQTVSADDVADAVVQVLDGKIETRRVYDLVEDHAHSLGDILDKMRAWLGIAPAPVVYVPSRLIYAVARVADGLGWLGWRSPLRTTAISELSNGVTGDPAPWRAQSKRALSSLETTLRHMPSTVQERWYARAFLFKPVAIAALSLFWLASGVIALFDVGRAASVLTSRGGDGALASIMVIGGAIIDIMLGLAILRRTSMPWAAMGMIAVTLAYLIGGTLLAPGLWLDPLGPLVKAIPGIALALGVLALAEDR